MSVHKSATHIVLAAIGLICAIDDSSAVGTGTVTAGAATITNPNPTTTLITQTSNKSVINWTNFNTTAGQTVQFVQPSLTAVSLNIIGGGPTSFNGNLLANGKVWLVNPDGMLFGSGATVNVNSLLLSTAGISNATTTGFFTNPSSTYVFDQAGNPTASITINNASITTPGNPAQGGDIIIQAPQVTVTNASTLYTPGGNVQLLAGQTFTADFNGDGLINFEVINSPVTAKVPGATSSVEVSNNSTVTHGKITVGAVIFQDAVLDHVINLGGQYEVGTYNQATNPQHVVVQLTPNVYETIIPNPATTVVPSTVNGLNTIQSLTRTSASLSDESVKDTTVNPSVANVTYERPYLVNLPTSIAEGNLTLLAPSAGTAEVNVNQLGNLSPSAGGKMAANATDLGNLSPAAGGTARNVTCANAFLDSGWSDTNSGKCTN